MGRPPGSKNRTVGQIQLDAEIATKKAELKALEIKRKNQNISIKAERKKNS